MPWLFCLLMLWLLYITQLSTTSTSRAAFLQCLRWGVWCPFQEPTDWIGEEIQLVLRGGAKPNPYGVMVYSTEMPAKTQSPVPLRAAGTAQVTHQHRGASLSKEQNGASAERCRDKRLFPAHFKVTQMFPWGQKHPKCIFGWVGHIKILHHFLYWYAGSKNRSCKGTKWNKF